MIYITNMDEYAAVNKAYEKAYRGTVVPVSRFAHAGGKGQGAWWVVVVGSGLMLCSGGRQGHVWWFISSR